MIGNIVPNKQEPSDIETFTLNYSDFTLSGDYYVFNNGSVGTDISNKILRSKNCSSVLCFYHSGIMLNFNMSSEMTVPNAKGRDLTKEYHACSYSNQGGLEEIYVNAYFTGITVYVKFTKARLETLRSNIPGGYFYFTFVIDY